MIYIHFDPGTCPLRSTVTWRQLPTNLKSQKTLRYIDTLTQAIARQDPPRYGGFSTLYSMVTPRKLPDKTLCNIDTLTLANVRQVQLWHRGVSTFYSMVTPRQLPRQDPPLYRHLDPGKCPPKFTVTWVMNAAGDLHQHVRPYSSIPGNRNHGFWPSQPVSKQYF